MLRIILKMMSKVHIIGEIGINHNGDIDIAKQLITIAAAAGFDSVKFQKRNPDVCVPQEQAAKRKETPWGEMSYLEYKHKVEFGQSEYEQIDECCRYHGIDWTASPWDLDSVNFMKDFGIRWAKIASASNNDESLVRYCAQSFDSLVLSTGMSTMEDVKDMVSWIKEEGMRYKNLSILHCNSSYPAPLSELNLNCIHSLRSAFPYCRIGYSGHEFGLIPTISSVAMGAKVVERHITLDRNMWGSDHLCSVEPQGMFRLVRAIRELEEALGSSDKVVTDSELPKMRSLRG